MITVQSFQDMNYKGLSINDDLVSEFIQEMFIQPLAQHYKSLEDVRVIYNDTDSSHHFIFIYDYDVQCSGRFVVDTMIILRACYAANVESIKGAYELTAEETESLEKIKCWQVGEHVMETIQYAAQADVE